MFDSFHYCQKVSEQHRKEMGQFFTHSIVASFMVKWVLRSGIKRLYDPAFGLGAFLPPDNNVSFTASEIDSKVLEYCREQAANQLVFVQQEDYLTTWGRTHSNVVCNPPYMRFQKFVNRDAVFQKFQKHLDLPLSGYTNTASAFLLKSLSEMDGHGRLSYVMPLEFLNAGYGTLVKKKLLENQHLFGIISLECEKDIFPDATTSVGIILYDCSKKHSKVAFYSVKTLCELESFDSLSPSNEIDVSEIDPTAKWLPYFNASKIIINQEKMVPLDHYGRFSRGIATGANEFFVLSKSKAAALELPLEECQPCITRSSQISHPIIDEDDINSMLEADIPVLLFTANGSASEGALKYIKHGESAGYHERFLTKHRKPWYKTEKRFPSHLLLGVFSRGGYKVILNRSKALNLTCYHGFQPNLLGIKYLHRLFLYFLSKAGREIIGLCMRKYGDALDKFEPNDLNAAFVLTPTSFDMISNEEVECELRFVCSEGRLSEVFEEKFTELVKQSRIISTEEAVEFSKSPALHPASQLSPSLFAAAR
jgi:adenine-specific DNA-methyltransferase